MFVIMLRTSLDDRYEGDGIFEAGAIVNGRWMLVDKETVYKGAIQVLQVKIVGKLSLNSLEMAYRCPLKEL